MAAILTAAEMRALEQAAIERGEVTGLELMERAGRGVVEAILAEWPGIEEGARRAVVLCGPGNNGGDGFVVARLLKERGWEVFTFFFGDPERLPSDARVMHDRCLGSVEIKQASESLDYQTQAAVFDACLMPTGTCCVVDALFGLGLKIGADLAFSLWLNELSGLPNYVTKGGGAEVRYVAMDVPSGLCADSGRVLVNEATRIQLFDGPIQPEDWETIPADLTVTFHSLKPGHTLASGPASCGKLAIVDIGLEGWRARQSIMLVGQPERHDITKRTGHKYGYGHPVVLVGGCGKGGAARMAARGALRIGAGLVTLAVSPAALQENAARLDAIMLRSIKDADALRDYLADDRLNALCAGPGLGLGETHGARVGAMLGMRRPTVLDGDALTLVSKDLALRRALHDKVVLTPHEGEFARLFPEIDARWRAPATTGPAYSKVDAARDAAKEAGCVVLLKGPDTVIADPSGRAAINAAVYERAAPWLATAGSGDTLAGFITGLLARGFQPFDAACTAAWLHVECARSFGPGLIAEDLADELPKVLRALGV